MAKGDVHVLRANNGGWRLEIEGSGRPRDVYRTQQEAWDAGRQVARRTKRELLIHGRDGRIRERSTYGDDPPLSQG